jgi:hypothetical protein
MDEFDKQVKSDSRPSPSTEAWVVWRQDDNGNQVAFARFYDRREAEKVASDMESRGHKQIYWVSRDAI